MGTVLIYPPRTGRGMLMDVTVRTESGRTIQFRGRYAHTFDAYDDALERHQDCTRIEVKLVPAVAPQGPLQ